MDYNLPPDLVKAAQNCNLIPIVGAGVSMSLTDEEGIRIFPSWGELLSHAAEELRLAGKDGLANGITSMLEIKRFQMAAQLAREGLQGTLWSQFFRKHFEEPLSRISENSKMLPKAIWGLGNRVLTLNYDKVLRGACPGSDCLSELDNTNKAELADFKRGTLQVPAIWHFHGRIDNMSSLIFTVESYDKLYTETDESYQAGLQVFRGLCRDNRLLFVGCSLEDAELLHEMAKQHQLFNGNTGPHYALVHKEQRSTIEQKINGLSLDLLTFEDFGAPLVAMVTAIANHVPKSQRASEVMGCKQNVPKEQQIRKGNKKIALLSANPLDEEQQYPLFLNEFKKIACQIDHFSLNTENLNNLTGYDYLFILSKVIKNKLLIENDYLCSQRISFEELEERIGNEKTEGVFIFVDQAPAPSFVSELHLPTLILANLEKKQLENFAFQLFRKNNLDYFSNDLLLNRMAFELSPQTEKSKGNNIQRYITPLPDSIDPKTVRGFIGRTGDLEQICRRTISQKEEGGILTIKGSGGIGKTATMKKVAVALAERGHFEGGINFVDCEPITDNQQFEYKVASAFNLEQGEDLKQNLRNHHDKQSRLIIIDNFETLLYLDDHKEIKALLSSVCDYATIVTTSRERLQIEGEIVYEMRQLTTDEAVELFIAGLDQREIPSIELDFLRQEIIENLLDNNPLAIKLITGNMPKGKELVALKEELETDLFSKISVSDLEVFDDSSDLNIARKRSIYGSILYSYKRLLEHEQRAFELLSLFPDGIGLETFKRLTRGQGKNKKSGHNNLPQTMITDKVIKALENKSMIENNKGQIKLQSIVGRFADGQLRRRDDTTNFYNNAFKYNDSLLKALDSLHNHEERDALVIFNSQQGNFLKSISYCDKIGIDLGNDRIVDYLYVLDSMFTYICSFTGFIRELSMKRNHFEARFREYVDLLLLNARYFAGDFENSFRKIQNTVPLETLLTFDRAILIERHMANLALNIYVMEGDALSGARYDAKHGLLAATYRSTLFQLGEYNEKLARSCKHDFFTLDILDRMGLLRVETIDEYLAGLYDKDHLEHMQVSYLRSKLEPLEWHKIDALVTINPYTRGLKNLMFAFIESDVVKVKTLYQEAIYQLNHIKYYHVEALYYYTQFLHKHNQTEFDSLYRQGTELAKKHHYRFLQYLFEQLLHPTTVSYGSQNYPLPGNEDFTDFINLLIKYNK